MEKQFAPSVVSPPCASKIAWKTSTISPKILVTQGPKRIAPRPVPVMWEQLPVTDGIFRDEITNTKAPVIARSVIAFLSLATILRIPIKPNTKNGIQTTYQKTRHPSGRYPSITCMALDTGAKAKIANKARSNVWILFLKLSFNAGLDSLFLCCYDIRQKL